MSGQQRAWIAWEIAIYASIAFVFVQFAGELLWLLAKLVPLIFAVLGVRYIVLAIKNWKQPRRTGFLVRATVLGGLYAFLWFTPNFGRDVRFAMHRAGYEEKVKIILQAKAEGRDVKNLKISGLAHVDDGPPVRVAFYWFRGVTDNWVGLVFDPTGDVMKVNQLRAEKLKWDDPRFQGINMLFDGELYHAEHLSGHWYLCGFT